MDVGGYEGGGLVIFMEFEGDTCRSRRFRMLQQTKNPDLMSVEAHDFCALSENIIIA